MRRHAWSCHVMLLRTCRVCVSARSKHVRSKRELTYDAKAKRPTKVLVHHGKAEPVKANIAKAISGQTLHRWDRA